MKQREGEKSRLAFELQQLEARLRSTQLEVTPEALNLALSIWRGEVEELRTSGDLAALRRTLSRFITRIEMDYSHVRIWYTYPIDGFINPDIPPPCGGTLVIGLKVVIFQME